MNLKKFFHSNVSIKSTSHYRLKFLSKKCNAQTYFLPYLIQDFHFLLPWWCLDTIKISNQTLCYLNEFVFSGCGSNTVHTAKKLPLNITFYFKFFSKFYIVIYLFFFNATGLNSNIGLRSRSSYKTSRKPNAKLTFCVLPKSFLCSKKTLKQNLEKKCLA